MGRELVATYGAAIKMFVLAGGHTPHDLKPEQFGKAVLKCIEEIPDASNQVEAMVEAANLMLYELLCDADIGMEPGLRAMIESECRRVNGWVAAVEREVAFEEPQAAVDPYLPDPVPHTEGPNLDPGDPDLHAEEPSEL